MSTIAAQLEAAGVTLDAELPVRVRWSVSCRTGPCRFALVHLPTEARARKAAAEHLEAHAGHDVEVCADVSLPLGTGGPEPPQDRRSPHRPPRDTRRGANGIPDRALHCEVCP